MRWFRDIGPGVLIAAAFIGPGTVTLCTIAGASFGYSLIWAIILSIFSTIVLQEMSLRIGLITKMNLAQVIRINIKSKFLNRLLLILIISSILIGNAAYEAGNITGASLGISAILNSQSINYIPIFIGLIAFIVLYQGDYKVLERSLVFLVLIMSISFFITAIITKPDINALINGVITPKIDSNNLTIILGLNWNNCSTVQSFSSFIFSL